MQAIFIFVFLIFVASALSATGTGSSAAATGASSSASTGFVVCPSASSSAKYCEACLTAINGTAGCGWCVGSSGSGFCNSKAACTSQGSSFITKAANCTTCSPIGQAPNVCLFTAGQLTSTSFLSYCQSTNTPPATNSTSNTTTTKSCSVSKNCLNAIYGYACSSLCSLCDATNASTIGRTGICQNQCDDYNNVSCKSEIAAGCASALGATSCNANGTTCNPWIHADSSKAHPTSSSTGTGSTSASTGSSPTKTTTAASTATTATAAATTAATTASAATTTKTTTSIATATSSATGSTTKTSSASSLFACLFVATLALLAMF